jgi:hypothetical protein
MESVFGDDRLDLGQFGNLMDQGSGVLPGESMATPATRTRLAVEGLADLLGRDQGAVGFAMSALPATLPAAGRGGRLALQADGIGRGGLGRVGGVELEPRLEVTDPRFEFVDPLLHHQEHGGDGRLRARRHLGPEFIGDGQRVRHDAGIVSRSAIFNPSP